MAQTRPTGTEKEPRKIVKKVDMAILYSDRTILVQCVRAFQEHVLMPYVGENDEGKATSKFGIVALMPKTKIYFPAKDLIRDELNLILSENKIGKNEKGQYRFQADRKFFRDGDQSGKEECEGFYTISAGESIRPQARDIKIDPKTKKPRVLKVGEDDDVLYRGCWVNVLIRPWYQDHKKYGKRINAGLVAVQLAATPDGYSDEPYGNTRISSADVDDSFSDTASGYEADENLGEDEDEL